MNQVYFILGIYIFIVIVCYLNYYRLVFHNTCLLVDIDSFIDTLEHGDIIFFCRKHLYDIPAITFKTIACTYLNTVYYHVGIVIEKDGQKKLLSLSYYTNSIMKPYGIHPDVNCSDLREFLYKHTFRVKVYRHPMWNSSLQDIDNVIKNHLMSKRFYFNLIDFVIPRKSRNNMVCTSFIGLLLYHLGYIPKTDYFFYDYVPGRIEPILENNGFINRGFFECVVKFHN